MQLRKGSPHELATENDDTGLQHEPQAVLAVSVATHDDSIWFCSRATRSSTAVATRSDGIR